MTAQPYPNLCVSSRDQTVRYRDRWCATCKPLKPPLCCPRAGTFVTCSITGQFAVGRIHTHPQLFWQIESTAETPDLLAFIDHSTIAPVEPLYNEQFVQSEHAEGPPYILSTPQSEVAGPESTVRGHESIRGAFDVTTMVGWNGWTYFLSKQSSVLPLFNASLLLKTPVKSYTIGTPKQQQQKTTCALRLIGRSLTIQLPYVRRFRL